MPLVRMEDLPDNSRTWVFGADRDVEESSAKLLLREVDRFLSDWHAHGAPLTVARDWKYKRFLTVAVDRSTAGASGCSIDGLYRSLKALEPELGKSGDERVDLLSRCKRPHRLSGSRAVRDSERTRGNYD